MDTFWEFLSNEQNRDVLTFVGGAIAAASGGLWVVIRYFLERKTGTNSKASSPKIHVADSTNVSIVSGVPTRRYSRFGNYALAALAFGLTLLVIGVSSGSNSARDGGIVAGRDAIGNVIINGR
jgi:hypothetical protein